MINSIARLERHIEEELTSADETLAKFAQQLAGDAFYAFSWGTSAITAAAQQRTARFVEAWLKGAMVTRSDADEEAAFLKSLTDNFQRDVLRANRVSSRSTSAISNLIADAEVDVKVDWLRRLLDI